jgi:hypothetical protein
VSQQMARENGLWGVERIRGELLRLGIQIARATIQKYVRLARPRPAHGQNWPTFPKNHAQVIWACDFLQVIDLLFRQFYTSFIIELASRRVVRFGVTSHPSDAWVRQQLREATPYGLTPRFLIRDRDSKYGDDFARVAKASSIEVLKTPLPRSKGQRGLRTVPGERVERRPRSPAGCRGQAPSSGDQGIRRVLQSGTATPWDWAEDASGDPSPASLAEARKAQYGSRPQRIAPRLPACCVRPGVPRTTSEEVFG